MSTVLYEKRDRIAYITYNRPEVKNAIDPEMHERLVETWSDFRDDDSVDVAIVTGAGDAFCAGADLKTYIPRFMDGSGTALAGGLEQAMACDILIASDRARFGSFEARRGYHHGDGGIVRLVNACGVAVASHMLLTAEPIDAQQALQWHIVTRVVPHDRLMEEAETVARQILRNSQKAVRSAKETIAEVIGSDLDAQLRIEAWNGYSSGDAEETLARLQRFYERTDEGRAS